MNPILLAAALFSAPNPVDSLVSPSLAILSFQGRGITDVEAAALTDSFSVRLARTGKFRLIDRSQGNLSDTSSVTGTQGCSEWECGFLAGRKSGADAVMIGAIDESNFGLKLTVRMLDVGAKAPLLRSSEEIDGVDWKLFIPHLDRLALEFASQRWKPGTPTFAKQKQISATEQDLVEDRAFVTRTALAGGILAYLSAGIGLGVHTAAILKCQNSSTISDSRASEQSCLDEKARPAKILYAGAVGFTAIAIFQGVRSYEMGREIDRLRSNSSTALIPDVDISSRSVGIVARSNF